MNVPKEIILATLQEIHTSFNIKPHQLKITNYDEDFRRPDLVISNQQFSYNNKLYQLLVIEQPLF